MVAEICQAHLSAKERNFSQILEATSKCLNTCKKMRLIGVRLTLTLFTECLCIREPWGVRGLFFVSWMLNDVSFENCQKNEANSTWCQETEAKLIYWTCPHLRRCTLLIEGYLRVNHASKGSLVAWRCMLVIPIYSYQIFEANEGLQKWH